MTAWSAMRSFIRGPTELKPAGASCSRSLMPGATRQTSTLRAIAPAAMGLRKQTSCSRATDAAGGQSLKFAMNIRAQPQIVVVADAAAFAETAARRLIARVTGGDRAAGCLTGGSSPLGLYGAARQNPWRDQDGWN